MNEFRLHHLTSDVSGDGYWLFLDDDHVYCTFLILHIFKYMVIVQALDHDLQHRA